MKKYCILLTLLINLLTVAKAQLKDNAISSVMTERILSVNDVSYNTVLLLPRLYREHKTDTINAILNYYETNFGMGSTIAPFVIINKIKNKTFKESLENKMPADYDTSRFARLSDSGFYELNIFTPFLIWYLDNYDIKHKSKYAPYIRNAYGDYIEFLQNLAAEERKNGVHTVVENLLLDFFAHPSAAILKQLDNKEFEGTLLQRAWYDYHKKVNEISGLNIGLTGGMWAPMGHLAVLGNHPYIGYVIGGRGKKIMVDLSLNFRFLATPEDYVIKLQQLPYTTRHFFGAYIAVDAGYEIMRKKRHEIDVLGGIGFSGFDALSSNSSYFNNKNANSDDASFYSADLNAGLGYRYYLSYHKISGKNENSGYLAVQCKYHYQHFQNDGTNLQGNALTFGLIYGGYSHKSNHYYLPTMDRSER